MSDEPEQDEPVAYRYTRKQAIEDGVLVDLTEQAREVGFVLPVACTSTVWEQYVVPDQTLRQAGQSSEWRLHDLLWTLRNAVCRADARGGRTDRLEFQTLFLMEAGKQQTVTLVAVCGPGDEAEPALTILLPGED